MTPLQFAEHIYNWETSNNRRIYVNHKKDPGRETVGGFSRRYHPDNTIFTLFDQLKTQYPETHPNKWPEEAKLQIKQVATYGFLNEFWFKYRIERLPYPLCYHVWDFYVTSGNTAVKVLQRMSGADDDGIIGQETIEQAGIVADLVFHIPAYIQKRIEYYVSLGEKTFPVSRHPFLAGWTRRATLILHEIF